MADAALWLREEGYEIVTEKSLTPPGPANGCLPKGPAAERLTRLATETGGRALLLPDTAGLDQAYQDIARDLRSRYRLAYESTNTHPGYAFRAVRVELGKPGLEARTISGYYP
jgi:hypothetical protein